MPEVQPLTPAERRFCRVLLVLAGAGVVVLGYYWKLVTTVCGDFVSGWVGVTLSNLLAGKLPRLDHPAILAGCLVSGLLGALFLISQYLAQLVGWGRWLRLKTLWFCTTTFGAFAGLLAMTGAPFFFAPGFGTLLVFTGLACLVGGQSAWRVRRAIEKDAERTPGTEHPRPR